MDNSNKTNLNTLTEFNWDTNTWDVIDSFFKQENVLIEHHIASFNYFMNNQLQSVIREKDLNQVKIFNKDSWNEELQMYLETYIIEFGKVYVSKPVMYDVPNKPMYPAEARLRKLTYAGSIYIDISHKMVTIDPKTGEEITKEYDKFEKYPFGKMPIMVGSKYCVLTDQNSLSKNEMGEGDYDMGGYFIIKGSEKVIISREKKCENKVYCFKHKLGQNKYSDVSEISCVQPENPASVVNVWVKMKAKEESYGGNVLRVRLRRMKQDIPLVIIFRALNFISDKSISELVVYNTEKKSILPMLEMLKASIEEARPITSQKIALEYISKYISGIQSAKYKTNKCKLKYTFETLCNELFPHIGDSPIKKGYFLGYMVNKLLKTNLGLLEYDDRDSFLNKRVETSGELMAQLFRTYFGQFVKDLKTICDKDMLAGRLNELPENLGKKLKPNNIEIGIKLGLATGNWGLKNQAKSKNAVAAVLQRLTYLGTLSNLRRIVAPLDKNLKQTEPRKLHSTHWGVICPFETPEGASIGIVKNMSMMCHITIESNPEIVMACLDEYGVKSLEGIQPFEVYDSIKVFVNGNWYGQSFEPEVLVKKLRAARRVGIINPSISISWYIRENEIQIWTDGGRLCRPLYIVNDNKLVITNEVTKNRKLNWKEIITKPITDMNNVDLENIDDSKAIIEYIDIMESDNIMVAMNQDNLLVNSKKNFSYLNYTHCEIHPSMILGVLASNIPFPDHNVGPRNLFQGAMGKQAMGIYSTSYKNRMDTMAHILHYPQKPMVNTEPSKYLNSDCIPSGQMAIVAVACYTGYNQQDSLIFNQSAIDRGLFGSSFFRTYIDEEKKNSTTLEDEKFCKPQKYYPNGKTYTEKMSFGSYDKLDDNGFVKVNSFVEGNDIIIGKVTMIKDSIDGEPKQRDLSTPLRANESGIVDKVYKNSNGEGYNFAKVRVRSDRRPEIGDKFACLVAYAMVLTSKGWKKIKDVTMEDKVAILDPETDNICYENPEEVHCYDYNGKMYKMKSSLVDLTVTPNHRMWVKKRKTIDGNFDYGKDFEFITADKCFGKRLIYKKSVSNYQPENWIGETFTIPEFTDDFNKLRPEIIVNMNDWLVFFGILLSEGWSDKNSVGIAEHKQRVKNALEQVVKNMGFKLGESGENWYISNVQLANIMDSISNGAHYKHMPSWVWNLNKEQSRLLIESMMLGDGYVNKSNADLYYTSSPQLADDLCRLCLHAGYSSHLRLHDERVDGTEMKDGRIIKSNYDNYTITIIKSKLEPEMNDGHKNTQDSQSEEWIDYEGTVHCLTVRTGIFLVRENGKPVWTGNSRHGQKGTIGMTYKQEDMPFTKNGVVPDLIMNPHALPKRMTIGQLIECVFGKAGSMIGCDFDATPFRKVTVENITEVMEKLGYHGSGTEVLYNGKTGEQITANIFIGPTFYYRLKHLVEDKLHSRSTGPYQLLSKQPAEGRSRDGGFRFGEMERDCFNEREKISLYCGLSTMIKDMSNNQLDLLGWDKDKNGLIRSKQNAFMYKGERECLKIVCEDGRNIICTPDHPILTSENTWVKAKDLKINETRVKAGVNYPLMNIDEEIKECEKWKLDIDTFKLSTHNKDEFLRSLAFVRILGYIVTDGYIHDNKNGTYYSMIYLGHEIDAEGVLADIRLFSDKQININMSKNTYTIRLPSILTNAISLLDGVIIGKKIFQDGLIPSFLLEDDCPRPIIREFLGGLFGGDGHTCYYGHNTFTSICFSKSKKTNNIESLNTMMVHITHLLNRVGINDITVQNLKETTASKKHEDVNEKSYQATLKLGISELVPFSEKVGFRYCCNKSQKLEAGVAYQRFREETTRQKMWIINRVDEMLNFKALKTENPKKNIQSKEALEKAIDELKTKEVIIHECAIPNNHDLIEVLCNGRQGKKFSSKKFPTAEEFIKSIGASEWFNDKKTRIEKNEASSSSYSIERSTTSLPTMNLKIIDIRPDGVHPVYDIEVDKTHSFVANGIVSHNCMLSHGAMQFLKERTFDCSDKYFVWVDNETGMISPVNPEKNIYRSLYSDNTTNFSKVQIPYSSKLLFQELMSMHIVPRIFTDKSSM
jgi:DNA-directed RNA polymerase II subunit RPB2